jgi:hypothetical protein
LTGKRPRLHSAHHCSLGIALRPLRNCYDGAKKRGSSCNSQVRATTRARRMRHLPVRPFGRMRVAPQNGRRLSRSSVRGSSPIHQRRLAHVRVSALRLRTRASRTNKRCRCRGEWQQQDRKSAYVLLPCCRPAFGRSGWSLTWWVVLGCFRRHRFLPMRTPSVTVASERAEQNRLHLPLPVVRAGQAKLTALRRRFRLFIRAETLHSGMVKTKPPPHCNCEI